MQCFTNALCWRSRSICIAAKSALRQRPFVYFAHILPSIHFCISSPIFSLHLEFKLANPNIYRTTMSYQQTTTENNNYNSNRSTSNMYNQNQARGNRDSQGHNAGFVQGALPADSATMAAMMNQFAGMGLAGANMAPTPALGAAQMQLPGTQMFYNPADNTYLVAPAMYPQALGAAAHTDAGYNSYGTGFPYFPQNGYPSYVPGLPLMPYTPNRGAAGYYQDRSNDHYKEVPGLENRRGSYSTNESAPNTPNYGSLSQRDSITHIAAVNHSPFGSTPSPQALALQHGDQQTVKPIHYKTIPINVDLDALLAQNPPIPAAVPAVFTPRESMRTLDQSLSNPIPGNRNVYIRGLHPNTDDETLAAYAARFGKVETSKAIIDTSTGACKG